MTAPAHRHAAADLTAATRRAEELEHVDCRWTHTGIPYEWDAGATIRALAADLAHTRAERDAALAALPPIDALVLTLDYAVGCGDTHIIEVMAESVERIRALDTTPAPVATEAEAQS